MACRTTISSASTAATGQSNGRLGSRRPAPEHQQS
jgi:hypothetical protein